MAEVAGKSLYFMLNAVDLSSFIKSVDLPRSIGTAEVTAGGDNSQVFIPTLKGATISIGGPWDDSVAGGGLNAILEGAFGVSVAWIYGPGGSTAGKRKFSGNGFITSLSIPSSVDAAVEWSATIQVSGDVTVGTF